MWKSIQFSSKMRFYREMVAVKCVTHFSKSKIGRYNRSVTCCHYTTSMQHCWRRHLWMQGYSLSSLSLYTYFPFSPSAPLLFLFLSVVYQKKVSSGKAQLHLLKDGKGTKVCKFVTAKETYLFTRTFLQSCAIRITEILVLAKVLQHLSTNVCSLYYKVRHYPEHVHRKKNYA